MEIIDNKYLEREFNTNYEYHEIFNYQKNETLDVLEKRIKSSGKNDILLKININNIVPYYKHRSNIEHNSDEEKKYWNHVVSILFATQLKEMYEIDSIRNIDEEKRVVVRGTFEEYKKLQDVLLNRDDIIEIIRNLKFDNTRLHIVINYFNNEYVWNELINYLSDDLPFITMIYSDSDIYRLMFNAKEFPTEHYKYVMFDKNEEGKVSYKLLDTEKNEVLKYEKKI